jgi:hypothetical protein
MGNISSVLGRGDDENLRNGRDTDDRQGLSGEDFISEAVASLELNHQDYQLTLHQYLSQRYADRYNNTQYEHNNRDNQQQRQRSHETPTNAAIQQNKETLSKNASFSQSKELIILNLKGKKIKIVQPELFYHDEVTSLDLSNNGNG